MKKRYLYRFGSVIAVTGVVLSPVMASAVSGTGTTTINATIGSVISMTTNSTVALPVTPVSGGSATSASDAVSVSTNNALGYTLTLADADATTTLTSGTNTIPASAGTFAAPGALANNTWGYRVDNVGTFGAGPTSAQVNQAGLSGTWAGVPATGSPHTLKSTSTTATNDITTVWYGVRADTTNPNGVYADQVTYTATTK